MSNPQRRREALQASATFHVAMVALGLKAASGIMRMWQSVVPTSLRADATSQLFYGDAVEMIGDLRHQAQAIVIPFIRLYRALVTGSTLQPVLGPDPQAVTLSVLRDDFIRAVERWAPDALRDVPLGDWDLTDGSDDPVEVEVPEGVYTPYSPDLSYDDIVDVDEIDGLEDILHEEERRAQAEAEELTEWIARRRLKERLDKIALDEAATAADLDALREAEHSRQGRLLARHADRMVQNGGRHAITEVGKADRKVIAWVRVHYPEKDPAPCGFCALLISRGLHFSPYRSQRAAELRDSQFTEFHPDCHCEALAVYFQEEFDEGERFNVNREMKALYDEHFKDMTQWRRFMRQRAARGADESRGGHHHDHDH